MYWDWTNIYPIDKPLNILYTKRNYGRDFYERRQQMTLLTFLQHLLPDANFHTDPRHLGLQAECDSIWQENLSDECIKKMSKTLLNFIYGSDYGYIMEAKKTYIDTDSTNIPVVETNTDILWVKVPTEILNEDCQHIMEIIDDASVNGLNFQYLNGEWYFGETQ